MYEDPQDMFREMDEMFSRLFARMDRGFSRKTRRCLATIL